MNYRVRTERKKKEKKKKDLNSKNESLVFQ